MRLVNLFNHNEKFIENKILSLSITGNFYDKNWIYKNQSDTFFKIKGIVNSILIKLGFDKCAEISLNKNMFEKAIEFRLAGTVIGFAGSINAETRSHFDIDQRVGYAELTNI